MVLLARADLPVNNAQELIAYLKKNNRSVTYGSWGQGGMPHLIMEAFAGTFFFRRNCATILFLFFYRKSYSYPSTSNRGIGLNILIFCIILMIKEEKEI